MVELPLNSLNCRILQSIWTICKLKTVTVLDLTFTGEIYEKDLISIANELPLLTELRLLGAVTRPPTSRIFINANDLIKLVKIAKFLRYIELWSVNNLHIDDHIFMTLANVFKESRRELYIRIYTQFFD